MFIPLSEKRRLSQLYPVLQHIPMLFHQYSDSREARGKQHPRQRSSLVLENLLGRRQLPEKLDHGKDSRSHPHEPRYRSSARIVNEKSMPTALSQGEKIRVQISQFQDKKYYGGDFRALRPQ